tara:strand:- start:18 stop:215 length:198 start_codon:yes stop_codon:yes gene_type:complete
LKPPHHSKIYLVVSLTTGLDLLLIAIEILGKKLEVMTMNVRLLLGDGVEMKNATHGGFGPVDRTG